MDDQVLQNLIRAASHCELPSANDVDRFIDEFHRRQRLLAMEPTFLEKVQKNLVTFFSNFRVPIVAYAAATAAAIVLTVLILHSPRLNDAQGINPLFSEESEAPFNYVSYPSLQQQIEPVTFELKKKNSNTDDVTTPLSFILKRKANSSIKKL